MRRKTAVITSSLTVKRVYVSVELLGVTTREGPLLRAAGWMRRDTRWVWIAGADRASTAPDLHAQLVELTQVCLDRVAALPGPVEVLDVDLVRYLRPDATLAVVEACAAAS